MLVVVEKCLDIWAVRLEATAVGCLCNTSCCTWEVAMDVEARGSERDSKEGREATMKYRNRF
jgi:hypothetical protein